MESQPTGYTLSRRWFEFCVNKKEAKCTHTAVYLWIVELNNRLLWKKEFGLPSADTMELLSIGNKNTYLDVLRDLQKWGFIKIIKESLNQYQACIITLCHVKSATPLDTPLIQHEKVAYQNSNSTEHSIGVSIDTIDKQQNNKTTKQKDASILFSQEEVADTFSHELKASWEEWKLYRKQNDKFTYKSPISEKKALTELKNLSGGNILLAKNIIDQSIAKGWHGLFQIKDAQKETPKADMNEIKLNGRPMFEGCPLDQDNFRARRGGESEKEWEEAMARWVKAQKEYYNQLAK